MDQQQIKTLIDLMAASDLSELTFSQDGWTLHLARGASAGSANAAPEVPAPPSSQSAAVPPSAPTATPAPLETGSKAASQLVAPLYGVLHLSPSPGEPPFAQIGDAVRAGQTLCVIEAMKVFNEVCAVQDGVLQAVLVTTGQEVEGGQPLFRFA